SLFRGFRIRVAERLVSVLCHVAVVPTRRSLAGPWDASHLCRTASLPKPKSTARPIATEPRSLPLAASHRGRFSEQQREGFSRARAFVGQTIARQILRARRRIENRSSAGTSERQLGQTVAVGVDGEMKPISDADLFKDDGQTVPDGLL